MSTQVNIRLDDHSLATLDAIAAAEGRTRAEVVRDAVQRRLDEDRRARLDASYRRAYEEHPETIEDLERAERSAHRLTGDEPWEPWW